MMLPRLIINVVGVVAFKDIGLSKVEVCHENFSFSRIVETKVLPLGMENINPRG